MADEAKGSHRHMTTKSTQQISLVLEGGGGTGGVLELLLFKIEGERKGMALQLLPSPPPLIFRSSDTSFARFEAYVFPLLPSS